MLKIKVQYNLKKDQFEVWSEVKKSKIKEVVSEFLRTQIGLGKDEREPNSRKIYMMTIGLDLSNDDFTISHDTGNDSLMTGLLMHLTSAIDKDNDQVIIH